jgi:soluble lytic murein transglycosylase
MQECTETGGVLVIRRVVQASFIALVLSSCTAPAVPVTAQPQPAWAAAHDVTADSVRALLGAAARSSAAGNHAAAASLYQQAAEASPLLADWASVWAAASRAESGDPALTRAALELSAPDLVSRNRWTLDLRAAERVADAEASRVVLQRLLAVEADADRRARILLALSRRSDDAAASSRALEALRTATSAAVQADAAARLDVRAGTAEDGRRAGLALLRQNRPAEAMRWLDRADVAATFTAAERTQQELELGRRLFNTRQYPQAIERLGRVPDTSASRAEALFITGRSHFRDGRQAQGRATFGEVIRRFPGTTPATHANYLLGDLAQDDGNWDAVRRYFDAARQGDANLPEAGTAWMRLAAMEFGQGRAAEAARLYDAYLSTFPTGRRAAEATYWSGRAHGEAGNAAQSRERFTALLREPYTYYGILAADRLGQALPPVPAPAAGWDGAGDPVQSRLRDRLVLLREFGRPADGAYEVERLESWAGTGRPARLQLAARLVESGWSIQGIRIAQQLQRQDGRWTGETARLLYPLPYRAWIERESRANGLDPFFVAALIRQESLFDSRATSPVGARGLMQVMPETGRTLARTLGIPWTGADVLYDPETSIRMGTRFLADLVRQTGGRWTDVLAGYNAGPHRIARWKTLPEHADAELFAERIPFEETRGYVKVIHANERIYRLLYAGSP